MVEEPRQLFERAQQQPADVQRRIAEVWRQELDELEDDEDEDEWEAFPKLLARLEESRRL